MLTYRVELEWRFTLSCGIVVSLQWFGVFMDTASPGSTLEQHTLGWATALIFSIWTGLDLIILARLVYGPGIIDGKPEAWPSSTRTNSRVLLFFIFLAVNSLVS